MPTMLTMESILNNSHCSDYGNDINQINDGNWSM